MIPKFQKEYENYWKNGDDIQEAEHRLNHLYMMRDRRLGKEEMDVIEQVTGNDFREEKAEDMSIFTGNEKVEKRIVRFGHTLYKRTEQVRSSYIVKDGSVNTYCRLDNFDGMPNRYARIASEVAVIAAAIVFVSLFGVSGSLPVRIKYFIISLLLVSVPVGAITYLLLLRVKKLHEKRAKSEKTLAEKMRKRFQELSIPVEYEEVLGELFVQIGMIQYAKDEKEVQTFHVADVKKVLKDCEKVVDYSIGEVQFSEYQKEGQIEYLPAELTVYQLKSNGKTLVPKKERVQIMLERNVLDWKLVEYRVVR